MKHNRTCPRPPHLRSGKALVLGGAIFATGLAAHAQSDYPGAIWRPAYAGHWNTSGSGHKFHVIHDIEGYYLSTISYFQKSTTQASVHFYVNGKKDSASDAPAGEVSQGVRIAYYAWHARCWNGHCTGTEHEGFASNPAWYTPELYQASADLTRWLGNHFGWAKDRNHIVAHGQKLVSGWSAWAGGNLGIDPNCNTHTDPGPYWDWSGYMNRVNGGTCVQGAILTRWNQLGGAGGVMGANTTCENTAPDGFGKYTHFQNGSIYWTSGTGAWDVRGSIRARWSALGWERSYLGYPTTGENALAGGAYNHFQNGSIYWTPSTGAQNVQGAIHAKWASLGWETGFLGYPTTSDAPTAQNNGYYNHFQGGSIFWSASTGAWSVRNGIRDKWASMNWEQGILGFPTTDETGTPDGIGAYNHFQGGSIYWSPSTGSHAVSGGIKTKWSALGWEQSYLGYPTTDETVAPDGVGRYNHFQNGSIYWTPTLGAHNVQGAINTKWVSLGREQSYLGYPTSDEYDYGTNVKRSDFQNGWIIYNLTTLQYSMGPGPTAPTTLTATAVGGTQVNLGWTDNAANENGFKVERSTDNVNFSQIVALAANVVTYTNTGVTSGTTYYYRVRSYQTNSADTTLDSAYSNVASVTPLLAPDLAAIGEKSATEGQLLTFNAASSNPNQLVTTTTIQNFETYPDSTPNDTLLFRRPSNSGSTSAFLDASTNYTSVKSGFPAGHSSARVLRAGWGFATGTSNPWLRFNTFNTATNPNPTIDLDQAVSFDIYSDKSLKVGVGVRETATAAAYGANGGTTGAIEWIGVTNSTGGSPGPSRIIAANTWTTLSFNVPFEKVTTFTGDGVVSSGMKGVLEELALVPNGGTGAYNVYIDNFAVVVTNTLTYSLDAGAPSGATIHPKTGLFKWSPTVGQAGTYNITVRVTDRLGLTDFEVVQVTVVAFSGNHKPVLSLIGNKAINEGSTLAFTASATDADAGQTLTYSLDAGAPAGATINSSTGAFSWTPTESDGPSSYPVTVRVTDNGSPSQTAFETITVTVVEVNVAPVVAAIGNQTINEGATLSATASATDSDIPANTLTYKLGNNAPAGMTINAVTGAISWPTTEANGPSVNTVTVTATDAAGLSGSQTFTVTVNELNVAPVLTVNTTSTSVETVTDFEGYPEGSYSGTVLFRQPAFSATTTNFVDLAVTNYTTVVANQPLGLSSQRALFASWSFKTGTTNPWMRLTTFNTVTMANPTIRLDQRLRFNIWTDKSLKVGAGLRETGTSANVGDNGGSTGALEWAGVPSVTGSAPNPSRIINASNWTTVEFNFPAEAISAFPGSGNGVLAAGKGVLDHLALVPNGGMGVYNVYVDNIQVVTVTSSLAVNTGSTVSLQCTASDSDAPAQALTFSLDAGAPTNAIIDATGLFSWTPTGAQGPSTNVITIRVTDNGPGNLSASQNISVVVTKVNTSPTITTVPEQAIEIQSGGIVTFTVEATDTDVPTNTLTFSLQGTPPSGSTINASSGVFSWTPPGNVSSTNIITVRVTDNGTPALFDERDLTIYVTATNTAPTLSLGTARATESVVTFETFTNNTPNEQVMFKKPSNSSTTIGFIDTAAANSTTVTTSFPGGHASAKVLKAIWTFKATTNNWWVRLTTGNTTILPNPAINAGARLKFDIYADKSLKVALGIRETGTTAENGGNGGTTGTIEYIGVTGVTSGTPQPTRTVAANTWTTLEFDLPNEPKAAFTGDGILNAGQQVLEHLALVGTTSGAHTVYVDNFEVVTTAALPGTVTMKANSTLTFTAAATDPDPGSGLNYGLDADAPVTAIIDMNTGAFTWTPTSAGTTNSITVFANDNPVNGAPEKTDSKALTVVVTADSIAAQSNKDAGFVAGDDTVTLTWDSVAGATYKVQASSKGTSEWTDVATVTASSSTSSASVTNQGGDSFYRIIEVTGGANE
ncbi:MAG: putative esterase [Verrucomicrobiales bacterium]|nr:putative esterase [Verrucomicrobiales bacterium]